jgi:hypothetical protein
MCAATAFSVSLASPSSPWIITCTPGTGTFTKPAVEAARPQPAGAWYDRPPRPFERQHETVTVGFAAAPANYCSPRPCVQPILRPKQSAFISSSWGRQGCHCTGRTGNKSVREYSFWGFQSIQPLAPTSSAAVIWARTSGGERPIAEGVVAKRLQPRAKADRWQLRPSQGLLQRPLHNLIGVLHGVCAARNPELKRRGIQHRRDVVHAFGDLAGSLSAAWLPLFVHVDLDARRHPALRIQPRTRGHPSRCRLAAPALAPPARGCTTAGTTLALRPRRPLMVLPDTSPRLVALAARALDFLPKQAAS